MNTPRTGGCPTPTCPPYYLATESYTATCRGGTVPNDNTDVNGPYGPSVTVTRQGRSNLSYEHARTIARALAQAEAEAELICLYRATACATPICGYYHYHYTPICVTVESPVSQETAAYQAIANARDAALAFCG